MINISLLKNLSYAKKYLAGTIMLMDDDDTADEMFIVLKGRVGIYSDYKKCKMEKQIGTIGPGGHFGEKTLFLGEKPSSTMAALEDVIALPISRSSVMEFIEKEPELTFEIMKSLISPPRQTYSAPLIQNTKPNASIPIKKTETQTSCDSASVKTASGSASLFPEGHGSYDLHMENQSKSILMEKSCVCPLCKNKFKALAVKNSKLIADHTDSDMRTYYKGIEPLYYDVISCPSCYYSALLESFDGPDKVKQPPEILQQYKQEFLLNTGNDFDTFTVFAGYYLALVCAPLCFRKPHLHIAKLYLKLSRIYHDCGDEAMELKMTKQAFDAYYSAYQNLELEQSLDQQLCLIIGELAYKLGDYKNARTFLFKAKTNKTGSPVLKRQAENRIEDIRIALGGNIDEE